MAAAIVKAVVVVVVVVGLDPPKLILTIFPDNNGKSCHETHTHTHRQLWGTLKMCRLRHVRHVRCVRLLPIPPCHTLCLVQPPLHFGVFLPPPALLLLPPPPPLLLLPGVHCCCRLCRGHEYLMKLASSFFLQRALPAVVSRMLPLQLSVCVCVANTGEWVTSVCVRHVFTYGIFKLKIFLQQHKIARNATPTKTVTN